MRKLLLLCAGLFIFFSQTKAQSFSAIYDFTNVSTTSGRTDPSPVPTATGASFGNFTAVGTGLSANPNAGGRFSFTGWPTGATNGSDAFAGSIDPDRYYSVTITPQPYYTIDLASITFTLQRSGTGIRQYVVRSSADGYAANLPATIATTSANLKVVATNVFEVADAATGAENGSTITLSGFTGLSSAVTFRFYGFNAESAGGTFSIDNVRFNGTATISPNAPNIILTPAKLVFPTTGVNTVVGPLAYTVKGDNLTDPVLISATAPYTVSDAENGTYSTSLTFAPSAVVSPKTVYVKFSPQTTGDYSGSIVHTSANATTKAIVVNGQGVDPSALAFDFNTCSINSGPGSGFTAYSVGGAQVWTCTSFGHNSTNGVNINGYSGGPAENEDWLISPPVQISSLNLPVLRFWSRGEFSGPSLRLLVSTDYDGYSNPATANWTDLDASFPPLTNTWTLTDGINLSAYKAAPKLYVAFKYTSTIEDGAPRWTVDDVEISDRSTLLTVSPGSVGFGEVTAGGYSAGSRIALAGYGFGDITVTAPAQFEVSADSLTGYAASLVIPQATAQAGTSIFARFAPTSKQLSVQGALRFTGASLDSNYLALTGTSYPKAETFDAGTYNLSFFGSNDANNPTPEKIATQIGNITTVLKRLNLDVVGVEEVSNDSAFAALVQKLPHHKALLSDRWSYSFNPPDPAFPPQKTGFIYDSTTMQLIETRDMFARLYDSARTSWPEKLPNYPGGSPQSFWASGRLPFMATFNVTINSVVKQVRVVDIHAKSASDSASYNRRVYDVKVLYDSLNQFYPNDNIIIIGDYNDRVFGTTYGGSGAVSPYKTFVDDKQNYGALTYPLDSAGQVSFVGGTGMIDHVTASNELMAFYITGSTTIEDPRSYIPGYNATTASDHFPVSARFNFGNIALPVKFVSVEAGVRGKTILVQWATAAESRNSHFNVERSANGISYQSVGTVAGRGNSSSLQTYQFTDNDPVKGNNYYRIRQVDVDGKQTISRVVSADINAVSGSLDVYPNPVSSFIRITSGLPPETIFSAKLVSMDGRVVLEIRGNLATLNKSLNNGLGQLKKGVYMLRVENGPELISQKFLKQ